MGKGIPAGQASFTLKLNDQLTSKLSKIGSSVKASMGRIGASAKSMAIGFVKHFASIHKLASTVVSTITKLGGAFAAYGDKFGKMSIRTGVGTEALQELSYAAQISGSSIDSLAQALFRARRRIGNMALGGGGPAKRALETLGLDAKKLSKMSPESQFKKLVASLKKVGNEAERNQLAFEIFGDNFRDIQPLIDGGAESMDKLAARANRLGLVLSGREIKQAEDLTDAFFEFGEVAKMVGIKIGAAFGPTLSAIFRGLAEAIADLMKSLEDLGGGVTVIGAQIKFAVADMYLSLFEQLEKVFSVLPASVGAIFKPILSALKAGKNAAFKDLIGAIRTTASGGAGEKITFTKSGSDQFKLELGRGTPEPVSTTGILSGFAAAQAASFGFNRPDPKKEEKEMVRLLGDIADSGPLLMEQ